MFKTTGKLLSLFLLLLISFIYTDKVFTSAKESDPIMKEVIEYKKENDIEPIEPNIKGDEIILGYSGLIIEKEESYKKMKNEEKFDKDKLVYNKKLPKNTITKTYEYYIKQGNQSKNNVALIFNIKNNKNVNELINTLKTNDILINFFIDGKWLEKNIDIAFLIKEIGSNIYNLGYDEIYSNDKITKTNNLIENITLEDSLYCLNINKNSSFKKVCDKNKMHSISATLYNPSYTMLKQNLKKGAIIVYDLDKFNMDEFIITINTITNKGYSITSLKNVLTE